MDIACIPGLSGSVVLFSERIAGRGIRIDSNPGAPPNDLKILGVYFAIALFTAKGEIVVEPAPAAVIKRIGIPVGINYYLKARHIWELLSSQ
jgi:hypothetical protein